MTESDPDPHPTQEDAGRPDSSAADQAGFVARATRDIAAVSSGTTFTETPQGDWNVKRAQHELKAATEVHRQQQEALEAQHRREQEAKDNDQQRRQQNVIFWVVVGVVVGVLVVSLAVSLRAENDDTLAWSRSVVTLIVGGVVGGAAGYITGKSGK